MTVEEFLVELRARRNTQDRQFATMLAHKLERFSPGTEFYLSREAAWESIEELAEKSFAVVDGKVIAIS